VKVLDLMAQVRSNHGITAALVVTEHSVEKHVRNILSKLGISADADGHGRVLAVLTHLRAGSQG
jgi:DNA-binding NarL/FixJ family response regulator